MASNLDGLRLVISDIYRAAFYVLAEPRARGDALTMRTDDDQPIAFAEWGYLGKASSSVATFRFDILTHSSAFIEEGTLFANLGQHQIFTPAKTLADDGTRARPRIPRRCREGSRMSGQVSFSLDGRNPDVLTCLANLSNDEVLTPPEFASRMLDTLAAASAADNNGANMWADSSVRFLDPCTKSGVFLREITSRRSKVGSQPRCRLAR